MKKVMIGILIIIPIMILLIVALVTTFLSVQAWVAVESMRLNVKGSDEEAESIKIGFSDAAGEERNFLDYLDVLVMPEKANKYTVEYVLTGDIQYQDEDYQKKYDDYIANKSLNFDDDPTNDIAVVYPAVMLIDEMGGETTANSSGKFIVNSYCSFTLVVQAEQISRTVQFSVVGYDVEKIVLSPATDSDALKVGESLMIEPSFTPIDSIVANAKWRTSDESVAVVDKNGIVTAKGAGDCTVYMSTTRADGVTVEGSVDIAVTGGVSEIFGDSVTVSKRTLTLEELGLTQEAIASASFDGCAYSGGGIVVEPERDRAVITTRAGSFEINICLDDSICIEHAQLLDHASGYVLAVGDMKLALRLVYRDSLRAGAPQVSAWRSSDDSVAEIDMLGNVTPKSDGVVVISAEAGTERTEIELNVKNKIASMRLLTTDASMAIGLARETVYASERYVDIEAGTDKEPNSVLVRVAGEPKRTEDMTDEEYANALDEFYSAFKFEVMGNDGFAHFDEIVANRLIFDSEDLAEKGKSVITVKVSAKFPKYETAKKYTEDYVHIKAIYGVEASSMREFRLACQDQKAYALAPDNLLPEETIFESEPSPKDGVVYRTIIAERSKHNYAICLSQSVKYYEGESINDSTMPIIFGDVYGNGYIISAETETFASVSAHWRYGLVHIGMSDVTMSNVTLRAYNFGDDAVIEDGEDVHGFEGSGLLIWDYRTEWNKRIENVRLEYSIFENARVAIRPDHAEFTLDGCILRNLSSAGIVCYMRLEDRGIYRYDTVNLNNVICSNSLGTLLGYTSQGITRQRYVNGAYRFMDTTTADNAAYFVEHFVNKGFNGSINQTGFLDIYNWQPLSNSNLIDVGDDYYNNIISTVAEPMLRYNSAFDDKRVYYDNEYYFHLGFFTSGVDMGIKCMDEPTFAEINLEDDRFYGINTKDLELQGNDGDLAVLLLQAINIALYGYRNDSLLNPGSSYQINSACIAHLHGEI